MKSQDELIGDEGTYKKRFGINRFKLPQQMAKNKFVDARTDQISTIPRTLEEHEELDALNSSFKGRLEDIASGSSLPSAKGKKKVEDIDENEERINKNKKRILEGQDALQLVETVPPYHAARDLDVPKLRNYYVFLVNCFKKHLL
ncbi:hypothetical protein RhiirA1_446999 [Rhizophagus irregularis]|uniref:Uncharacterized protein n=1 Tax=Rhizophagus irregularis TaxID=588596 RepID=A0A2N0QUP4_9GLOM|nr:hypothetical protein RhiirA1_446999 [Rhizophagus irregularis]